MKIVHWPLSPFDATSAGLARALQSQPRARLQSVHCLSELQATLHDANALVMSGAFYCPDVESALTIKHAPALTWLHLTTAGHDNVCLRRLNPQIRVTYSPGAGAHAAAEHGMSLVLAIARQLPAAHDNQLRARWDNRIALRVTSIEGCTLVVAGFGHIGQGIARLAKAFGMSVHAVNRDGEAHALADITFAMTALDTALSTADFVVVCLPLNNSTRALFGADRIARLPNHAALINLSRGPIVDPMALNDALAAGRLRAAALDVTDPEPLPTDHPLWKADNLLLTPHIAAAGDSPRDRAHIQSLILENVRRFATGDELQHRVGLANAIDLQIDHFR